MVSDNIRNERAYRQILSRKEPGPFKGTGFCLYTDREKSIHSLHRGRSSAFFKELFLFKGFDAGPEIGKTVYYISRCNTAKVFYKNRAVILEPVADGIYTPPDVRLCIVH